MFITCMGLPVPAFPLQLVDPSRDRQIVRVPFIIYRGTTYGSGAYVYLEKCGEDEFAIRNVALQPHLL